MFCPWCDSELFERDRDAPDPWPDVCEVCGAQVEYASVQDSGGGWHTRVSLRAPGRPEERAAQ